MIPTVFRLPIGIECSSNNGKVCVSGVEGTVSFSSTSRLYRRGDMVVFAPYLSSYYSSIFKQAVQGVAFGYNISLKLKGIGYRVSKEDNKLVLFLGYSRPVMLDIPVEVSAIPGSKRLALASANFGVLQNFASTIRSYRFPDPYKGAGVLYADEVVVCKEGKKT